MRLRILYAVFTRTTSYDIKVKNNNMLNLHCS